MAGFFYKFSLISVIVSFLSLPAIFKLTWFDIFMRFYIFLFANLLNYLCTSESLANLIVFFLLFLWILMGDSSSRLYIFWSKELSEFNGIMLTLWLMNVSIVRLKDALIMGAISSWLMSVLLLKQFYKKRFDISLARSLFSVIILRILYFFIL